MHNFSECPKKFWPGLSEMGFEIEIDYPIILLFFYGVILVRTTVEVAMYVIMIAKK